jgi:hypothetical protein
VIFHSHARDLASEKTAAREEGQRQKFSFLEVLSFRDGDACAEQVPGFILYTGLVVQIQHEKRPCYLQTFTLYEGLRAFGSVAHLSVIPYPQLIQ